MMLKNFGQMEQFVREQSGKKRVALAAAHDADALGSLMMAVDRGIAEAILIGRRKEIVRVLDEMGKDAGDFRIIEEADDRAAADKAVELVHCGEADMPMKGLMHTSTFMKAILDKEKGLKEDGNLLSQASVFEIPEKDRFLIISDCAVNIDPDLETKIKITENAAALAHTLGIAQPKIAVLSAVAGNADILIVPDLWSGNIFSKGLVFFAHLRSAGTLNGLKAPVVMSSRTDTVENKYLSILTAVLQTIR